MDYRVVITRPARTDLGQIVRFIAKHDRVSAEKVGNRLIEKAESLVGFPFMGSQSRHRGMEDCRVLIMAPYWIVYRVREESKVIEIFRFWHSARGIPEIYRDENLR